MTEESFLRKLKLCGKIYWENATEDEQAMLNQLYKEQKVDYTSTDHSSYYTVSVLGNEYLESLKRDSFRWWFTTIISVTALVLSLLSILMQLVPR